MNTVCERSELRSHGLRRNLVLPQYFSKEIPQLASCLVSDCSSRFVAKPGRETDLHSQIRSCLIAKLQGGVKFLIEQAVLRLYDAGLESFIEIVERMGSTHMENLSHKSVTPGAARRVASL